MNDPKILTARHSSASAETQRRITDKEFSLCVQITEEVIRRYAAVVGKRDHAALPTNRMDIEASQ